MFIKLPEEFGYTSHRLNVENIVDYFMDKWSPDDYKTTLYKITIHLRHTSDSRSDYLQWVPLPEDYDYSNPTNLTEEESLKKSEDMIKQLDSLIHTAGHMDYTREIEESFSN